MIECIITVMLACEPRAAESMIYMRKLTSLKLFIIHFNQHIVNAIFRPGSHFIAQIAMNHIFSPVVNPPCIDHNKYLFIFICNSLNLVSYFRKNNTAEHCSESGYLFIKSLRCWGTCICVGKLAHIFLRTLACRSVHTGPFSTPMLAYCSLDP